MSDEEREIHVHEDDVPPDGRFDAEEDRYVTGVGQVLVGLHAEGSDCHEHGCVIHNPTDHGLRKFPTLWRGDRGIMERICPHGIGHPDPDDQAFITRTRGEGHMEGVHGCDGCCSEPFGKNLEGE